MNPLSLHEIAAMCGGLPPARGGEISIRHISKDTRSLTPGDLYLAIKGDNFDGNQFVHTAIENGAAAAILDDPTIAAQVMADFPIILVENSLTALHTLAAAWCDRLKIKVIAITGSNGKTSTKEFTAAILSSKFRTTKTSGNLNNHIGLPLSILDAEVSDEYAVWEIGMNHPGEIAPLAALARPDIAIISSIGVGHIEYLGSRKAIAKEKSGLLAALSPNGTAILPENDDFAEYLATRTKAQIVLVGGDHSFVRAEDIIVTPSSTRFTLHTQGASCLVTLPVPGRHMVSNALCAVAAGLTCGISLEDCAAALASTQMVSGRLTHRQVRGITILDDSYNANPDSMVAALGVLKNITCGGRRIAFLGRMGELGTHAEEGYQRVGLCAAEMLDILVTVGIETEPLARAAEAASHCQIHRTADTAEARLLLDSLAHPGDVVLIKGSRSAKMENILKDFS